MKILVTGGTGYIGSHAVKYLLSQGHSIVIFDNLSNGFAQVIDILKVYGDVSVVKGDLLISDDLHKLDNDIDAVMHFAALCSVNDSVKYPDIYYRNNVVGTLNLLDFMKDRNIKYIIFSSTCAVYGETQYLPVDEKHPLNPINPYGYSKLMSEKMIMDFANVYNMKYAILRYFYVCGADKDGVIGYGTTPSVHLMQNAVRGAMGLGEFYLTYSPVDTEDGSPVRDYVDVEDLVMAHSKALEYIVQNNISDIFNLGNGHGYSVKEIVNTVEKVLNVKLEASTGEIRQGEYAKIYADTTKAHNILKLKPQKDIDDSVRSLIKWYEKYPSGYLVVV